MRAYQQTQFYGNEFDTFMCPNLAYLDVAINLDPETWWPVSLIWMKKNVDERDGDVHFLGHISIACGS